MNWELYLLTLMSTEKCHHQTYNISFCLLLMYVFSWLLLLSPFVALFFSTTICYYKRFMKSHILHPSIHTIIFPGNGLLMHRHNCFLFRQGDPKFFPGQMEYVTPPVTLYRSQPPGATKIFWVSFLELSYHQL